MDCSISLNPGIKAHQISFEARVGLADFDLFNPAARSDPIGQHEAEQSLTAGVAREQFARADVLADMIAPVMEMLPIFLQTDPAHSIDDG